MDKEKTGKLIKEARIRKGYTQTELGDLLGVTNKAVSRWEKGDSFPDVGILENLARCLDVRIEDLVTGEHVESQENTLTELLRIVRIQAKESARQKWIGISAIMCVLVITVRFLCAFILEKGYNWEGVYDILLMLGCFIVLITVSIKKEYQLYKLEDFQTRTMFGIGVVSVIIAPLLMIGGFVLLERGIYLFALEPVDIGPLFSWILGIITASNIIIIVLSLFLMRTKDKPLTVATFISIGAVFLCLSYREWMGHIATIDESFRSLTALTFYIFFTGALVLFMKEVIFKKGSRD